VNITGGDSAGGFVGANYGEVTGCSVNGVIKGKGSVGGFAGTQDGSILQCAANTEVRGASETGGFCGRQAAGASITDCYSLGAVVLDPFDDFSGDNLGGFIGRNSGSVKNCYAVTEVYTNFPANVIGAFGGISDTPVVSCYYKLEGAENWKDIGRLESGGDSGVTACTVQEITDPATFAGWDFASVWNISDSQNRGLPFLRAIFE
jgi:hypothetical protein